MADGSRAGAPGGGARRARRRRPGGRPAPRAALEPGDPAGTGRDTIHRRVLFREDARARGGEDAPGAGDARAGIPGGESRRALERPGVRGDGLRVRASRARVTRGADS